MDRPTGVTILAVLAILNGIIALIGGIGILFVGAGIFSLILFTLGILSLIYGWGLWNLRPWAWLLAVIGAALTIVTSILAAFGEGGINWLGLIINAIILWYLFRPEVKGAFGR